MSKQRDDKNIDPKFQRAYDMFKHNHNPDYVLSTIFELYLPFWACRTAVIVEKDLALDKLSKIFLELIQSGISKHDDLCSFLGVNTNSFITTQLHFLLKHGLLGEEFSTTGSEYKITNEGLAFLEKKTRLKNLETIEFDYFFNDIGLSFLDKYGSVNEVGKAKKASVNYRFSETRRLPINSKLIAHKNRPNNINKVDFARFFNQLNKTMTFYDLEEAEAEIHKRSVCFLALEYSDKSGAKKYDIRLSKKTSGAFKEHSLDEELSKAVTQYYKKNPL
ncbi:MAG: hypothetical protein KA163_05105 [Bacteroidia bacterium]|nr:hypothetical protein [Bacteroidia bacterium]